MSTSLNIEINPKFKSLSTSFRSCFSSIIVDVENFFYIYLNMMLKLLSNLLLLHGAFFPKIIFYCLYLFLTRQFFLYFLIAIFLFTSNMFEVFFIFIFLNWGKFSCLFTSIIPLFCVILHKTKSSNLLSKCFYLWMYMVYEFIYTLILFYCQYTLPKNVSIIFYCASIWYWKEVKIKETEKRKLKCIKYWTYTWTTLRRTISNNSKLIFNSYSIL